MTRIKKAQIGKLVKKATNKTLAVYKNSAGKIYKKDTEKSLEREALQDIKKKYAPKNKLEKKIDKREKKVKKDNDDYDRALWESYQRNGGKTRKRMQAGGVAGKQPKAGMVDPKGAYTKVQMRTLGSMKKGGKLSKKK